MSKRVKRRSINKSTKIRPIVMPLEPLKGSHQLTSQERMFLDAAERGDKHAIIRCLQGPNPVNINCTNMLGRTGIQIAVDNENVEIVELLLKQDGVKIGDALLYAITEGVYRIVEMLIDHPSISVEMLGQDWSKIRKTGEESSDYSPDISPVILAAHCNQFEILQLLITRGAYIDRPHQLSCPCKKCQDQVHEDSLRHSLLRINTYRALASPAWISLTSPDPILSAFKLSWELQKLALRENEFKDTYIELSEQCKRYACDLLNQCRSSEEVIAVLNKDCYDSEDDEEESPSVVSGEKLTLSRLKLALKYEQKQFVAHPHCQQLLTSIWYEGLPGWRKRNGPTKFLICMGLIFLLPFMSVYYLIFPRSKIGQLLRSPFMKFLYHSASFGAFLFFLLFDAFGVAETSPNRENLRGPPPTHMEWLIFFWVLGFVWSECKQLWDEGLKAYIRQWWNWLDFIMLSLYLATFSLRFVGYVQIESGNYGPRVMSRTSWPINDPTLVSEGLFSVANVFSFARIIYLFQANQHLGPLQISLGCMLIDIAKFLFIFSLVLTSFACGFNRLYWYYKDTKEPTDPNTFYTLADSYLTLYWSLFGLTAVKDIKIRNAQQFTTLTSMLLFMVYHAMSIIVLINMLIAMMSNSFQNIENHADMEWKFARSKLWMGYFDEGSTLPPPFNLLISPKSIYYFFSACKNFISDCCNRKQPHRHVRRKRSSSGTIKVTAPAKSLHLDDISVYTTPASGEILNSSTYNDRPTFNGEPVRIPPSYDQIHYQEVMKRLVSRYILQTKKQRQQDGVQEDDLLEIKQDISSLRYELREDRKREVQKVASQMDNIRREVISTVRSISPSPTPTQGSFLSASNYYSSTYNNTGGHGQGSSGQGTLSRSEILELKYELASSLRTEIREAVQDIVQNSDNNSNKIASSVSLPPLNSELYQTHLYTQL